MMSLCGYDLPVLRMMPVTAVCVTQCDRQVNTSFEDNGCATPCHHSVNHQPTSLLLLTVTWLRSAPS